MAGITVTVSVDEQRKVEKWLLEKYEYQQPGHSIDI